MKRFLILNNLLDKIISSLSHNQPAPAFNKAAYHNWRHFYRHNKRKVF
jgi:hypothetical protein